MKTGLAKSAAFAFVALGIAFLPSIASAQSSIAGVVKDPTGAVIAGASVQVSSEAIIEGTKTATTNGEGRYEIIDLRPGTYVVTATSAGFDTVRQTIELPANVTAPVDATLKPGSVGETVNVEARVATVDVENAARTSTLTRSEMDELPTGRYMQSIASYTPGAHLNVPDIGGSQQIEQNYISVHGNGSAHDSYFLDGMIVNTTYADGQIQQYIDNAAIQETTYQTSNVTAEASGGGMFTNLVPRDGGNSYHLSIFAGGNGGTGLWQADNLDANLNNRNLSGQLKTVKIEDFDGAFGGPIKKDKLWFQMTGREQITFTQAGTSTYPNGAPGIQDGYIYSTSERLTYQINSKNKFTAFWLRNWKYKAHEILDGGVGPYIPADPSVSSQQRNKWPMYYITQGRWTSTPTARLVIQTGVSISHLDYNDLYQDGIAQTPFTPAWYAATDAIDNGTLRRYFSGTGNSHYMTTRNAYTATANYITGSHQIKVGFVFSNGRNDYGITANGDGQTVFTNGLPVSFTAWNTPFNQHAHLDADLGFYVMDTWKYRRLSVTAGIRNEYLSAEINPENSPAGRFVPARNVPDINCNTIKGMGCWDNWAPRIGAVYDLFGNHKTAIKAGFGKYNNQYASGFTSNFNPLTFQAQAGVTWNTTGLTAPGGPCAPVIYAGVVAPNPLCYPTGGFAPAGTTAPVGGLGVSANPNFGLVGATPALDPKFRRDYNLQYTAGIQQELRAGITLNLGWYRRSAYQQPIIINEAVGAESWTPVTIDNPLNGTPITVYNSTLAAFPAARLYQTNAPQSLAKNVYTGYEASIVARLRRGTFLNFGYTIDRQLDRSCYENTTTSGRPNDPNSLRFCDMFNSSKLNGPGGYSVQALGAVPSPPWAQEFTIQGSIPIRYGIVASASFLSNRYQGNFTGTSNSGTLNNGYLARTWAVSPATRYPVGCIGCLPAGTPCQTGVAAPTPTVGCPVDPGMTASQGSETLNLVAPGQVLTPRLNQLDVSFKRTFKFREKYVLEPTVQIFNVLNSNAAVSQATSLGATTAPFLTPAQCAGSTVASNTQCGLGGNVSVVTNPRLLKLALLFRF